MAVRLLEMRRILKPTGSIYLHCDSTASHYLKLLMDSVFGSAAFQNEVSGSEQGAGRTQKDMGECTIPFCTTGCQEVHGIQSIRRMARTISDDLIVVMIMMAVVRGELIISAQRDYLVKGTTITFHGHDGPWRCPQHRMEQLEAEGRIYIPSKGRRVPSLKRYLRGGKGVVVCDTVTDIHPAESSSKERTGFPTQKPLALYARIIKASSNKGDIVLDPFAGCATTLVAAELMERKWVGIDLWDGAYGVINDRMDKEVGTGRAFSRGGHLERSSVEAHRLRQE